MAMSDVKRVCMKSLERVRLGTDNSAVQDGKDFYKFMFENYPDLRVYFKGAQNYTATDVQNSERFEKQGQRIILAMHILANTYDELETFKAYARETVNRHRQYKLDPPLWKAFFTVFLGYLRTKTNVDDETKSAWMALGDVFSTECLDHLKNLQLAH